MRGPLDMDSFSHIADHTLKHILMKLCLFDSRSTARCPARRELHTLRDLRLAVTRAFAAFRTGTMRCCDKTSIASVRRQPPRRFAAVGHSAHDVVPACVPPGQGRGNLLRATCPGVAHAMYVVARAATNSLLQRTVRRAVQALAAQGFAQPDVRPSLGVFPAPTLEFWC